MVENTGRRRAHGEGPRQVWRPGMKELAVELAAKRLVRRGKPVPDNFEQTFNFSKAWAPRGSRRASDGARPARASTRLRAHARSASARPPGARGGRIRIALSGRWSRFCFSHLVHLGLGASRFHRGPVGRAVGRERGDDRGQEVRVRGHGPGAGHRCARRWPRARQPRRLQAAARAHPAPPFPALPRGAAERRRARGTGSNVTLST